MSLDESLLTGGLGRMRGKVEGLELSQAPLMVFSEVSEETRSAQLSSRWVGMALTPCIAAGVL